MWPVNNWCWHRFSKWGTAFQTRMVGLSPANKDLTYVETFQTRECSKCGLLEQQAVHRED